MRLAYELIDRCGREMAVRNCVCKQEFTEPWDFENLGIMNDGAGKEGTRLYQRRVWILFIRHWEVMDSF